MKTFRLKVNLNDEVLVRLTPHGREVEERWLADLFRSGGTADELTARRREIMMKSCIKEPDEAGFTRWNLHELMLMFGEQMVTGSFDTCFEGNNIYFEEKL
jgi:hypothetical protein